MDIATIVGVLFGLVVVIGAIISGGGAMAFVHIRWNALCHNDSFFAAAIFGDILNNQENARRQDSIVVGIDSTNG